MLKKLLTVTALAALLVAPATPAMAQYGYGYGNGNGFGHGYGNGFGNGFGHGYGNGSFGSGSNIDQLQAQLLIRINQGRASGRLTQFEFNQLMSQYNMLSEREAQLRMGGLNFRERMRLQAQLQNLNFRVNRNLYDRQTAGRWGGGRFW